MLEKYAKRIREYLGIVDRSEREVLLQIAHDAEDVGQLMLSPGWKVYRAKVKERIEELKNLLVHVESNQIDDVGRDIARRIEGLQMALDTSTDIFKAGSDAEEKLRRLVRTSNQ